jgi:mono/diheme cytochrome c family protein
MRINQRNGDWMSCAFGFAAGVFLLAASACSSEGKHAESAGGKPSGSALWAQNCGRCHNFRSPADFSDGEWDAITLHMRVRANLTAEEYTLIRDFLKASN